GKSIVTPSFGAASRTPESMAPTLVEMQTPKSSTAFAPKPQFPVSQAETKEMFTLEIRDTTAPVSDALNFTAPAAESPKEITPSEEPAPQPFFSFKETEEQSKPKQDNDIQLIIKNQDDDEDDSGLKIGSHYLS